MESRSPPPSGRARTRQVGAVVPDEVVLGVEGTVQGGAVVEHGAEQPLRRDTRPLVVQALDQAGGQSAAGALSADGQSARRDPQLPGVERQPLPAAMRIVEGRGEGQ